METVTTTTTIYNYEELSEKAKEKVGLAFREINDFGNITVEEYMRDNINTHMEKNGIDFNIDEIYFSLCNSQGDGASFTGKGTILDGYDLHEKIRFNVTQLGKYVHEYTMNFELETEDGLIVHTSGRCDNVGHSFGFDEGKRLDRLCNRVQELGKKCIEIAKENADIGYDHYEYVQSDEYISEKCKKNYYKFTADGELFNR